MAANPLRPKLSDVLHADLLEEINRGHFGEGGRLPSEADLGQRFGVSRPIVREALSRLREEGIIRSKKGSGSYVVPQSTPRRPGDANQGRTLASITDIQKLYQYRMAVEGEIAYHAALSRTEQDIRQISEAAIALGQCRNDGSDGTEEDIDFHMAIARATQNPFFVNGLENITVDMRFIVELARGLLMKQPVKAISKVQAEHEVILTAIRERDAEGAREHMKFHLSTAHARLFYGAGQDGAALWQDGVLPGPLSISG
ncbi:MAG: FadR/GntR family transcriptional regulator [Tropicimonas sp.]|uniref:FadR/GntR family transcriptional regulator n=1 Tax=Tropicimonas sp. TaxID=2067044 RepID=UPI003A839865